MKPNQSKNTLEENGNSSKEISHDFDLNYLINNKTKDAVKNKEALDTSDDYLVDITDEKMLEGNDENITETNKNNDKHQDLKLSDFFINLDEVKPSSLPPLNLMNERNGISITLHFARDKPREDVSVFVVTTVSKNAMALSDYLFQAVVPKVSAKLHNITNHRLL